VLAVSTDSSPSTSAQPTSAQASSGQPSSARPSSARPSSARPTAFEAVGEFHAAFGVTSRSVPTAAVPAAELALRQDLLDEEVDELRDAVRAADVVAIADALADIVYIACGTAQALGIPFDDVFAEVHRANMSKLGADGRPILRADGKILKGPTYTPPDVAAVLAAAAARAARPPNPEPGGG
jgi:predicted HAD superfamily Cof-like phosphohydrolase